MMEVDSIIRLFRLVPGSTFIIFMNIHLLIIVANKMEGYNDS